VCTVKSPTQHVVSHCRDVFVLDINSTATGNHTLNGTNTKTSAHGNDLMWLGIFSFSTSATLNQHRICYDIRYISQYVLTAADLLVQILLRHKRDPDW